MRHSLSPHPTRRSVLTRGAALTAGAIFAPTILPSRVLGQGGHVAPNSKVRMGCIGVGGMGMGNLHALKADPRVQMVAVCDVEAAHRENARSVCGLSASDACIDFRDVLAREDVDAVMIATPDHWHAVIASAAARAGKDIYCEKPLSLTYEEGSAVRDLINRYARVFQLGTWRRSRPACRFACELVRSGYIGELQRVMVGVPEGFNVLNGPYADNPQPPPQGLDYDMWLGPAPWAPYSPGRVHFNFRWIMDYSAGYITDWGAHYMDIAHWGIGADGDGPTRIRGQAHFPTTGIYDAPDRFRIEYTYPPGISGAQAIMFSTTDKTQWGMRFEGTKGWIKAENYTIECEPESLKNIILREGDVSLYRSSDHHKNFIDCVYSRQRTAADIDIAHGSTAACHLGAIAVQLGQDLNWNPRTVRFENNEAANRMLSRANRGGWRV